MFKKAERIQKKLRLAISGVSGSGKTYSALAIASGLGSKVAVIDTEHGSASLYSEYFDFDCCILEQHHPNKYIEAINFAGHEGYEVIVIDSLSHAWLEMLNLVGGNFNNWAKIRPLERQLIESMLRSPADVLVTMRSKSDYVDSTGSNGKATKVKVGTKAVMAEGIEYEFDVAGTMDLNHILTIEKSRCSALQDTTWSNPGIDLAARLKLWLAEGNASVDQSVNEFKSAVESQPALFKEAYTSAGIEREAAIAILRRFGVDHPKFLTPAQFQDCIALIKESAA